MPFTNKLPCYICGTTLAPRQMVRINEDINANKCEIAIRRREAKGLLPLIITDVTRICMHCNQSITSEIEELERDPACLRLNVLKQTSSHTCVICNAGNVQRLSIACRINVFIIKNIYVPEYTRSCPRHLDEHGLFFPLFLQGLQFVERPYVIKGPQLNIFLQELRNAATRTNELILEDESMTDNDFKAISSMTKAQFLDLYAFCDQVPVEGGYRSVSKKNLLTFLCKLRQGLSDEFLKVIFKYPSRQATSLVIGRVRELLMQRFVPENIGFGSITREEYIQRHVTEFANELYNPEPDIPKAIAYIDGTYSKIEKSSNYRVLRQSYCIHKGYHLVKPALIVAPDGFILDIQGPYFSDSRNNDAQMLRNEFERDINGIRAWFQKGDILIVDRGYRDATELLERLGIRYHMPALLQPRKRQFPTAETNSSRLVTKTRWIVEARNGHIKTIFHFFYGTIPTAHVVHLGDFYRIAGALINRYHEPLLMQGADVQLAREMMEKARDVNVVKARVEIDNLHSRNARWIKLNQYHVPDFPRLTLNYLRDLTVGVYQVNLAPSYVQDKLQREEMEVFEFDELREDPFILRFRIFSRYRNATKYQLWIVYALNNEYEDNPDDPIVGYYCTCKSGARTLGSCAHIASVLWFLGYARHEQNIRYPSMSLFNRISDAGNRAPQINPNDDPEII